MTVARNKRAGAEAEMAVAERYRVRYPEAHVVRPRLNGTVDLGDVHVVFPAVTWVLEVKRSASGVIPAWLSELRRECDAVRVQHPDPTVLGWLIVIPKGALHREDRWMAVMEDLP